MVFFVLMGVLARGKGQRKESVLYSGAVSVCEALTIDLTHCMDVWSVFCAIWKVEEIPIVVVGSGSF